MDERAARLVDLMVVMLADAPAPKELAKQAAELMGLAAQIVELAR
jgi:hypothetical protein